LSPSLQPPLRDMAFSTSDTIVAIATPPGRGGIGVVRLSGPDAHAIAGQMLTRDAPLEPRRATFSTIHLRDSQADQVVVTFFPSPGSYTGDDVVEISGHGSPVILRGIVTEAMEHGARLAEPGEFTLRAYVNGRLDLPQAEAVADLIDAVTPLQARIAFDQLQGTLTRAIAEIDRALFDLIARLEASVDFPDEGYHFIEVDRVAGQIDDIAKRTQDLLCRGRAGRLVREGLDIAIIGEPNVGKSSVFNALVGSARAIVTPVAGTTRDLVSETVDLDGLRVRLIDTAGLRQTDDVVESEGVERSMAAAEAADLVLVVIDQAADSDVRAPLELAALGGRHSSRTVVVGNKIDLLPRVEPDDGRVMVSAVTGQGIDTLKRRIVEALDIDVTSDPPELTNVRHIALVERAHEALLSARLAAGGSEESMPEEFVLADLQRARAALEEISGRRAAGDLLEHIFSRFCVGK
jgi:tRNA modification GTPase